MITKKNVYFWFFLLLFIFLFYSMKRMSREQYLIRNSDECILVFFNASCLYIYRSSSATVLIHKSNLIITAKQCRWPKIRTCVLQIWKQKIMRNWVLKKSTTFERAFHKIRQTFSEKKGSVILNRDASKATRKLEATIKQFYSEL